MKKNQTFNDSSINMALQEAALFLFQLLKPYLREQAPEQNEAKPEVEEPVSIQEVCALLRVSRPTLHSWMAKGTIPFHRKGRRVFLFKTEVLSSLEQPKRLSQGRRSA